MLITFRALKFNDIFWHLNSRKMHGESPYTFFFNIVVCTVLYTRVVVILCIYYYILSMANVILKGYIFNTTDRTSIQLYNVVWVYYSGRSELSLKLILSLCTYNYIFYSIIIWSVQITYVLMIFPWLFKLLSVASSRWTCPKIAFI